MDEREIEGQRNRGENLRGQATFLFCFLAATLGGEIIDAMRPCQTFWGAMKPGE
jgi:hypothetical protein